MVDLLTAGFYVIIFPGLMFSTLLGLFFCGVDRKMTAFIQSRVGPPWYQCYVDVMKLMNKIMILPRGSRNSGFLLAPLLGLTGIILVSTIIWRANLDPEAGFAGDLIVILYLLTLPSLSLIIGGSSSKNPFGALGASREMKMILAYELPFLMAILIVIVKVHSILLGNIVIYQSLHGMLVKNPSCIFALIVCLPCIQAKLGYIPFDIPEAETEIIGGTLAEYSGAGLALFKLTNAIMLFTLPVILISLFLGGVQFTVLGIFVALIKYLGIFILIILAKTVHPRLRIDQAIRFFWYMVTPVAVAGMVLALIGV
jgi:NADH-quinone oxidoreductase subunit H